MSHGNLVDLSISSDEDDAVELLRVVAPRKRQREHTAIPSSSSSVDTGAYDAQQNAKGAWGAPKPTKRPKALPTAGISAPTSMSKSSGEKAREAEAEAVGLQAFEREIKAVIVSEVDAALRAGKVRGVGIERRLPERLRPLAQEIHSAIQAKVKAALQKQGLRQSKGFARKDRSSPPAKAKEKAKAKGKPKAKGRQRWSGHVYKSKGPKGPHAASSFVESEPGQKAPGKQVSSSHYPALQRAAESPVKHKNASKPAISQHRPQKGISVQQSSSSSVVERHRSEDRTNSFSKELPAPHMPHSLQKSSTGKPLQGQKVKAKSKSKKRKRHGKKDKNGTTHPAKKSALSRAPTPPQNQSRRNVSPSSMQSVGSDFGKGGWIEQGNASTCGDTTNGGRNVVRKAVQSRANSAGRVKTKMSGKEGGQASSPPQAPARISRSEHISSRPRVQQTKKGVSGATSTEPSVSSKTTTLHEYHTSASQLASKLRKQVCTQKGEHSSQSGSSNKSVCQHVEGTSPTAARIVQETESSNRGNRLKIPHTHKKPDGVPGSLNVFGAQSDPSRTLPGNAAQSTADTRDDSRVRLDATAEVPALKKDIEHPQAKPPPSMDHMDERSAKLLEPKLPQPPCRDEVSKSPTVPSTAKAYTQPRKAVDRISCNDGVQHHKTSDATTETWRESEKSEKRVNVALNRAHAVEQKRKKEIVPPTKPDDTRKDGPQAIPRSANDGPRPPDTPVAGENSAPPGNKRASEFAEPVAKRRQGTTKERGKSETVKPVKSSEAGVRASSGQGQPAKNSSSSKAGRPIAESTDVPRKVTSVPTSAKTSANGLQPDHSEGVRKAKSRTIPIPTVAKRSSGHRATTHTKPRTWVPKRRTPPKANVVDLSGADSAGESANDQNGMGSPPLRCKPCAYRSTRKSSAWQSLESELKDSFDPEKEQEDLLAAAARRMRKQMEEQAKRHSSRKLQSEAHLQSIAGKAKIPKVHGLVPNYLSDDPYQVLGLRLGTRASVVKQQYMKLALLFHPDKNKDPRAKQVFCSFTAAYRSLTEKLAHSR